MSQKANLICVARPSLFLGSSYSEPVRWHSRTGCLQPRGLASELRMVSAPALAHLPTSILATPRTTLRYCGRAITWPRCDQEPAHSPLQPPPENRAGGAP